MRIIAPLLLILLLAFPAHAKTEREYQEPWCKELGGEIEVVMSDRTRCDCLTDEFAIEVDFAEKWAEGLGQALLYAAHTGKRPGVALIVGPGEDRFVTRLWEALLYWNLPVRVWIIKR